MVKLLIFDVGGVFRDSSEAIDEGLRRGFEASGRKYDFKAEDVWHLRGIGKYNSSRNSIKALLSVSREELLDILKKDNAEQALDNLLDYDDDVVEKIRTVYKKFFYWFFFHCFYIISIINFYHTIWDLIVIFSYTHS